MTLPFAPSSASAAPPRWSLPTRLAFRFSVAYIFVFIFPFPQGYVPGLHYLFGPYWHAWDAFTPWVGTHVLGLATPPHWHVTGSGDTAMNYVDCFSRLLVAVPLALLWSVLDRRRLAYPRLLAWVRLWLRLYLIERLSSYGFTKVFPLQMPAPDLFHLLEPYGHSSPEGLLWTFIGASPPFEMFCGAMELLAVLLLVFPRTVALGAVVTVADMGFIFTLNLCYDVPVKLMSFHYLAFGLFLLAPELPRLARLFCSGQSVALFAPAPLFSRPLLNRAMLWFQLGFAGLLLGPSLMDAIFRLDSEYYGPLAEKSPLYGVWQVDEFSRDGQVLPPLLTDATRWRTVIFDDADWLGIGACDDTRTGYQILWNFRRHQVVLINRDHPGQRAVFTFQEPHADHLILTGTLDGHAIRATLVRDDDSKMLLTTRGFHWISEDPFNR